jgi:hypothetical protein
VHLGVYVAFKAAILFWFYREIVRSTNV